MSDPSRTLSDAFDFVRLSDGLCHYRVDGPSDGTVILLIHSATVSAWEFDRLAPFLTSAGYRALRADLFGHGYSDRPRVKSGLDLFVRQLSELLDSLEIKEPVHLLGHSLGAAIGACMAGRQPGRFQSLVLAAPLLSYTDNAKVVRLLECPLIGELLIRAYVLPMLVRRRTRRYRDIEDGRFVGKFKSQLRKPGFGRALLSLVRNGALRDQGECYGALNGRAHPVLLLRGAEDTIVTLRQIEVIRDLVPRTIYRDLAGAGHAFLLINPEEIAPILIDFLARGHGHRTIHPSRCGAGTSVAQPELDLEIFRRISWCLPSLQ